MGYDGNGIIMTNRLIPSPVHEEKHTPYHPLPMVNNPVLYPLQNHGFLGTCLIQMGERIRNISLVGGFNPSETNMKVSWEGLSHILWKNKIHVWNFETTNQMSWIWPLKIAFKQKTVNMDSSSKMVVISPQTMDLGSPETWGFRSHPVKQLVVSWVQLKNRYATPHWLNIHLHSPAVHLLFIYYSLLGLSRSFMQKGSKRQVHLPERVGVLMYLVNWKPRKGELQGIRCPPRLEMVHNPVLLVGYISDKSKSSATYFNQLSYEWRVSH